jgi:hypothetical protein
MSTLVRGHGPHYTWLFFFGNSNCPTLFICYKGSIEKLTLLGAIYYYYYLDSSESPDRTLSVFMIVCRSGDI